MEYPVYKLDSQGLFVHFNHAISKFRGKQKFVPSFSVLLLRAGAWG